MVVKMIDKMIITPTHIMLSPKTWEQRYEVVDYEQALSKMLEDISSHNFFMPMKLDFGSTKTSYNISHVERK